MIRKNIIKNKNDKQRYFLNDSWRIEMPAVVRTPFYGNNCSEYFGYVVTYSEMEQAYHLLKVDLHNGKILWSIDAVNGGYGTPTVFGDLVVFLKEFDAVQAVSAESGIVEWAVQGGHRVRTTLNVIDETLWFGSGSTLLAVNKNGEVVKKLHIPNSFIYGNITPYKGGILCTGTLHNNERDCSCSYLWLINQEGSIMYSMELGRSPVISSDTSGIWLKDDFAFASCGHDIICFDLKVGKELWRTRVFGFCGRHFPVVDSQRVYYTTLKGEVGCADILNGSIVWRQKFREGLIVAPPSIYGKTLFVLADCSVFLLDKDTGEIFQHKVVGHTPYSAVSFGTNKALIGAGEPPANGQLICFDVVSEAHVSLPMYNDVYFLEEKDCNLMSVLIETGGEYTSSSIDVSVFSKDGVVNGKKIGNAFTYKFNLQNNCVSGFYAIPVLLENFGLIERKRRGLGKPSLVYVKNFSSNLSNERVQNRENHESGSPKNACQDSPKSRCNKNKKSKTERNNTNPILSDELEKMKNRKLLEEYFSRSLEIELLLRLYPDDEDTIYQIVDLLVDTCDSKRKLIRIAGDDKPAEVVLSRLKKLNADHIRFVLDCLAANTSPIRNMKQYLLAALFNAPTTIQLYYQNKVNHDLAARR